MRGLEDSYTVAADELRERGFAVVVAHPERAFRWSEAGWETLEHELAVGSALQINAWSVAGLYGEMVRANALWLLCTAPRARGGLGRSRRREDAVARVAVEALAVRRADDPDRTDGRGPPRACSSTGSRSADRAPWPP